MLLNEGERCFFLVHRFKQTTYGADNRPSQSDIVGKCRVLPGFVDSGAHQKMDTVAAKQHVGEFPRGRGRCRIGLTRVGTQQIFHGMQGDDALGDKVDTFQPKFVS